MKVKKAAVVELIKEYRDETLNQGQEFGCSDETFKAIMADLLVYLECVNW